MADARNVFLTEHPAQIPQMFAEIIQIHTLGPVVRIFIEESEELPVLFLPVGDPRFHDEQAYATAAGFSRWNNSRASEMQPLMAAAATMTGDIRTVRPVGEPWRPLKFRLDEEAQS